MTDADKEPIELLREFIKEEVARIRASNKAVDEQHPELVGEGRKKDKSPSAELIEAPGQLVFWAVAFGVLLGVIYLFG